MDMQKTGAEGSVKRLLKGKGWEWNREKFKKYLESVGLGDCV